MPHVQAPTLDYPESDEHILRRLGGAVVFQWSNLPADVQALLVEQAVLMHSNGSEVQLTQQIETFVQRHQPQPGRK